MRGDDRQNGLFCHLWLEARMTREFAQRRQARSGDPYPIGQLAIRTPRSPRSELGAHGDPLRDRMVLISRPLEPSRRVHAEGYPDCCLDRVDGRVPR